MLHIQHNINIIKFVLEAFLSLRYKVLIPQFKTRKLLKNICLRLSTLLTYMGQIYQGAYFVKTGNFLVDFEPLL